MSLGTLELVGPRQARRSTAGATRILFRGLLDDPAGRADPASGVRHLLAGSPDRRLRAFTHTLARPAEHLPLGAARRQQQAKRCTGHDA